LLGVAALALLGTVGCATDRWLAAPNPGATPVDQMGVSGNACGPASLLNAFSMGDPGWRRAATAINGDTDRERLTDMLRRHGLKPSESLSGRRRWQARHGMNIEDLAAMANEMAARQGLPPLRTSVYQGGDPAAELRTTHAQLARSLARGLPPVVSLRRHALRKAAGGPPVWTAVKGHFVVVTGMPSQLAGGATSFPITYLDPWGARPGRAEIRIPDPATAQLGLAADFPTVAAGRDQLHPGEPTALTLNAALGRF
jgi:hypothetical protein